MNDIYLTAGQAALALGVSPDTVRTWGRPGAKTPLSPDRTVDGRRYYALSSIRRFADKHGYTVNPDAPVVPALRPKTRGCKTCPTP